MSEVLDGSPTLRSTTEHLTGEVLARPLGLGWVAGVFVAFGLLNVLLLAVTWLLIRGVGIWGVNIPVAWGFAIANFVWWIGIGHAGTFISAILFLLHQSWRNSISRFAETMTLFAVACAGLFPLLHLGRPWYFYWLLPYPDTMNLWPQFRSPLIWDIFAVFTYLTVSLVFWYVGLLPDLASLRDRAEKRWLKLVYGALSLGWRNSAAHWQRYRLAYLLLAGLATPLVISVHSIVGMDFTGAIVPGWHSTIFPPYFVAGAIFSGFAMVLTLGIPLRRVYRLEPYITRKHLDNCAKLLLAMGLLVSYSYLMEHFMSWYSGNPYEVHVTQDREGGVYSGLYWTMMFCNVMLPQLLWISRVRVSPIALFAISLGVNLGMWLERVVIVITSLHHDYLPSMWKDYYPTLWDWLTLAGSLGLFFFLFLLFVRSLPVAPIAELRELIHEKAEGKTR